MRRKGDPMRMARALAGKVVTYVQHRRLERRFSCRIHGGAEIHAKNRHRPDSITIGPGSHIRGELFTSPHGGHVTMGSHCYLGDNSRIWSAVRVSIGDRVLIRHNSSIFDSDTHPMAPADRHRHFVEMTTKGRLSKVDLREEPVLIEDDVWIGCNAVILKGVTIGRGAVIGAGSIVTHDVPPYAVAAGNPARVVRELTADER